MIFDWCQFYICNQHSYRLAVKKGNESPVSSYTFNYYLSNNTFFDFKILEIALVIIFLAVLQYLLWFFSRYLFSYEACIFSHLVVQRPTLGYLLGDSMSQLKLIFLLHFSRPESHTRLAPWLFVVSLVFKILWFSKYCISLISSTSLKKK